VATQRLETTSSAIALICQQITEFPALSRFFSLVMACAFWSRLQHPTLQCASICQVNGPLVCCTKLYINLAKPHRKTISVSPENRKLMPPSMFLSLVKASDMRSIKVPNSQEGYLRCIMEETFLL